MKDPYRVLGVPRNATAAEIKSAYRILARDRHPDLNQNNPHAESEFKDISAAYGFLSDPKQRDAYDAGTIDADGNPLAPGWAGSARNRRDFSGSGFRRGRRNPKVQGADVSYTLRIGFADAIRGVTKRVSLTNGKTLDVRIPAGCESGQVLRLNGQGMRGSGGGEPGAALIEVLVDPDPTPEAPDARIEVAVTLEEAVLGARIDVPTPDGTVRVTIPPGSNTGTVLRLRRKKRADRYVALKVVLPPEPDAELVRFVREWSPKHPYRVRAKSGKVGVS